MKTYISRNDFFTQFEKYFDEPPIYFYSFDIDTIECYEPATVNHTVSNELTDNIHTLLSPFLSTIDLPIEQHSLFLQSLELKVNFDWDYSEECEGESCRYNCEINLHKMYDQYIFHSKNELPVSTIYRIEKNDNKGLYDSVFCREKVESHHPSPNDDPLLNHVFSSNLYHKNNEYKNKWSFGFDSVDDAKKWMGNSQLLTNLQEDGFILKKIYLPSPFVIHGNGQAIFQKSQIIHTENLDLLLLQTKPTFKI